VSSLKAPVWCFVPNSAMNTQRDTAFISNPAPHLDRSAGVGSGVSWFLISVRFLAVGTPAGVIRSRPKPV
jgi:hypothetical protein